MCLLKIHFGAGIRQFGMSTHDPRTYFFFKIFIGPPLWSLLVQVEVQVQAEVEVQVVVMILVLLLLLTSTTTTTTPTSTSTSTIASSITT